MFSALMVGRQRSEITNFNIYRKLQNMRSFECKPFILRNSYTSESEILQFPACQPASKYVFFAQLWVC
jgi:hypothetical protein